MNIMSAKSITDASAISRKRTTPTVAASEDHQTMTKELPSAKKQRLDTSSALPTAAAAASSSSSLTQQQHQEADSRAALFFAPVCSLLTSFLPIMVECTRSSPAGNGRECRRQLKSARDSLQQLHDAPSEVKTPAWQIDVEKAEKLVDTMKRQLKGEDSITHADESIELLLRDQLKQLKLPTAIHSISSFIILLAEFANHSRWLVATNIKREEKATAAVMLQLQSWMKQASSLLYELADALTADEVRANPLIISGLFRAGLLTIVVRLLRFSGFPCDVGNSLHGRPHLTAIAIGAVHHCIDLTAGLRFIPHGLDPTLFNSELQISALQIARVHVKKEKMNNGEEVQSQVAAAASSSSPPPNLLLASCMHNDKHSQESEMKRRIQLKSHWMNTLVAEWRDHSSSVRKLLLQAAPDRLIPDLTNICADYLDLDPLVK